MDPTDKEPALGVSDRISKEIAFLSETHIDPSFSVEFFSLAPTR